MTNIKYILMTIVLMAPAIASAQDLTNHFGVSGIIGPAFPVAPDYVTSHTNSVGLTIGFLGSFYVSPALGVGISYENIILGEGQRVAPIDVLLLYRMLPHSHWTPTFQAGFGSAKGINSDRIENVSAKAGLGIDWFITPSCSAGPQVNYYFISHSADANTVAHLVGVNLLVTYYFGTN
jgi:hypothetical protein